MIMRGIQSGIRSGIDSGVNGHLSGAVPVIWTAIVNCTADGSTLRAVAGALWDAGAVSVQSIPAGSDGYAEYSITDDADANTFSIAGLSVGDTDVGNTDVDFAAYIRATLNPGFGIRENATYYAQVEPTAVVAGERIRVQRIGTEITYWRDDNSGILRLVYTSLTASTGELLLDCTFQTVNAWGLADAVIYAGPIS